MDKKLIDRINELAHKKKKEGLTDEELAEQKKLREEYLKAFRKNFRAQLDNVKFVEDLTQEELIEEVEIIKMQKTGPGIKNN